MNIFGLEIRRASPTPVSSDDRGGWKRIHEPFTGAWQRNIEWSTDTVLAHHAVFACITRIAQDIGKLRPKLVEEDDDGIWSETWSAAFSGVLARPNRFQNHIQFKEWWTISKLIHGNTYALKQRDARNIVTALYLLDPMRVTVLVGQDGEVFYQLKQDHLSGVTESEVSVPASEIVHDRMNCLFHPLVGVSPIFACGVAANMGLQIQNNSSSFFGNGSTPSGLLSSPVTITPQKSKELSEIWNSQYGGANSGKVAVLGDGMTFVPMRMSAVDSQLIDQLNWSAEQVCSTFHVPPWKIGIGSMPAYTKPEIANQAYYTDCLQAPIEAFELCMDEGLGLTTPKDGKTLGVELDLDGLLRMDTASQVETLTKAISGSLLNVNGARKRFNEKPVPGGDSIWMQQQNYSLEALAERDRNEPFAKPEPAPALPAPEEQKLLAPPAEEEPQEDVRSWSNFFLRDAITAHTERASLLEIAA